MDPACLCCDRTAEIGVLCRACAAEVEPCEGLIADHVHSTVDPETAAGWVVDGFGTAHALASRSTVGRSQEGQLVILAKSISREHARLERVDTTWEMRDLGSRNGTFISDTRVQGRAILDGRARIKIGDVALWFLAEVRYQPAEGVAGVTETAATGMMRYAFTHGGVETCIVGTGDPGQGGALLSRATGTASWKERSLAPLEFQLLRTLCRRAIEEASSPTTVRGAVATKQLAKDLPFQSRYANEENVRQVVRRVRAIFDELGGDGSATLAVSPGLGYYLACPITLAK